MNMNTRITPDAKEQESSAKEGRIAFFFAYAVRPCDETENGPEVGRFCLWLQFTTQLDRAATFVVSLFRVHCCSPTLTSTKFQPVAA